MSDFTDQNDAEVPEAPGPALESVDDAVEQSGSIDEADVVEPEVQDNEGVNADAHDDAGYAHSDPIEAAPEPEQPKAPRRERGALEQDVKDVTDDFAKGGFTLAADQSLTPHRIANEIGQRTGNKPSAGAVAACLGRWVEIGFAVVSDKPLAFVDYTDAARTKGLAALKTANRESKKAESAPAEAPSAEAVPEAPVEIAEPAV